MTTVHLNQQQTHTDNTGSSQSTANSYRWQWLISVDSKSMQVTLVHLIRQQQKDTGSPQSTENPNRRHWLISIINKLTQTTLAHLNRQQLIQVTMVHLNRQQTHTDDNGPSQSTANSNRRHWSSQSTANSYRWQQTHTWTKACRRHRFILTDSNKADPHSVSISKV